jgi:hypothetical protein
MKSKSVRHNNKVGKILKLAGALALAIGVSSSELGAVGFSTNLSANGVLWSYGYEGGTYPTNGFGAGNFFAEDLQGAGGSVTVTSEGLTIDTGVNNDGMGFRLYGPSTVLPATNVWTVEYRMRMLTGHPFNAAFGVEFRTAGDAAGFVARASQNAAVLTGTSTVVSNLALGTDWHTYRVVSAGGTSKLFVDDMFNPVLSVASSTAGGNRWLEFGDWGAPSGSAEYDYIRWAIGFEAPEPSTGLLLVTGGLVLWRCRRRKAV